MIANKKNLQVLEGESLMGAIWFFF